MELKPLKQIKFDDQAIALFANNLQAWTNQFHQIPFLNGRLLTDIAITTSNTEISHGLGRPPKGYLIVDQTAGETVFRSEPSTSSRITLKATGNVTVSLWIF